MFYFETGTKSSPHTMKGACTSHFYSYQFEAFTKFLSAKHNICMRCYCPVSNCTEIVDGFP